MGAIEDMQELFREMLREWDEEQEKRRDQD
jgi:hypothetical protein